MNGNDMKFDAALRAHHHASLEQVSPRVQAQLAQRRNASLRGETPAGRRRAGFRYAAAGFAALCALAIGLQFRPSPVPSVAAPAMTASADVPVDTTVLDEDPEFYAWLASSDAQLVAME